MCTSHFGVCESSGGAQAADYLDDAASVQQLCHHAAQWLFAPPSEAKYSETQQPDQLLARRIPEALPKDRLQVLTFSQPAACQKVATCDP
jgi:hypothetical protein